MNLSRSKCGLDVDMEYLKRQLREDSTRSAPLPAPSCSTSSCCPTSSVPSGSASSGATTEPHLRRALIDCKEDQTGLDGERGSRS
jgi:hypothetical protein